MPVVSATLTAVRAFESLDSKARKSVAIRLREWQVEAGATVVRESDPSTDVYFIVAGLVRARIFSRNGKEVSFRDIDAGDMFGDLAAIDGCPRCANVEAKVDSVLLSMSAADFRRTLREHPSVADIVLAGMAASIRALSERVVEFSTLGVKNRIHAELLRRARQVASGANSAVISPPPTHQELASHVSTHREAVTKALSELERAGVICSRARHSIVVPDISHLQSMVDALSNE